MAITGPSLRHLRSSQAVWCLFHVLRQSGYSSSAWEGERKTDGNMDLLSAVRLSLLLYCIYFVQYGPQQSPFPAVFQWHLGDLWPSIILLKWKMYGRFLFQTPKVVCTRQGVGFSSKQPIFQGWHTLCLFPFINVFQLLGRCFEV